MKSFIVIIIVSLFSVASMRNHRRHKAPARDMPPSMASFYDSVVDKLLTATTNPEERQQVRSEMEDIRKLPVGMAILNMLKEKDSGTEDCSDTITKDFFEDKIGEILESSRLDGATLLSRLHSQMDLIKDYLREIKEGMPSIQKQQIVPPVLPQNIPISPSAINNFDQLDYKENQGKQTKLSINGFSFNGSMSLAEFELSLDFDDEKELSTGNHHSASPSLTDRLLSIGSGSASKLMTISGTNNDRMVADHHMSVEDSNDFPPIMVQTGNIIVVCNRYRHGSLGYQLNPASKICFKEDKRISCNRLNHRLLTLDIFGLCYLGEDDKINFGKVRVISSSNSYVDSYIGNYRDLFRFLLDSLRTCMPPGFLHSLKTHCKETKIEAYKP